MGIYIDYTLRAECAEEELCSRLERVRQRCFDLPLARVGEVRRIAPVYNPIVIPLLRTRGSRLPKAIAQRLKQVTDPHHGELCIAFSPMFPPELPRRQLERYYAPALDLIRKTDLWSHEDLPEQVGVSAPGGFTSLSLSGDAVALEFASIMLRYGYLLIIDPGEGCETVSLALSTFGQSVNGKPATPPLWYGMGFTKTQYAKDFVQVHETVCRVLDIAREEGLLHQASDNCGYYASRTWQNAGPRVNEELLFTRVAAGLIGAAIGNLREEGMPVQVLQDNASKARPVDFSAALARERETKPE